MLADFGELRALAKIPCGKVAGAWARSIGLALYQFWREQAHKSTFKIVGNQQYKTVQVKLVTRREFFDRTLPDPSPYAVLSGDNPACARKYWDDAIEMLRAQKIISKAESSKQEGPRKGWATVWLDEEIDLRPHPENVAALTQIEAIADGARTLKRKRGRPKKPPVPTESA